MTAKSIEFSVATEASKTSKYMAAQRLVKSWLIEFSDTLGHCQKQFPSAEKDEVEIAGSIKRQSASQKGELPMQKIKLEHSGSSQHPEKPRKKAKTTYRTAYDYAKLDSMDEWLI